jgi:hypothetical protein
MSIAAATGRDAIVLGMSSAGDDSMLERSAQAASLPGAGETSMGAGVLTSTALGVLVTGMGDEGSISSTVMRSDSIAPGATAASAGAFDATGAAALAAAVMAIGGLRIIGDSNETRSSVRDFRGVSTGALAAGTTGRLSDGVAVGDGGVGGGGGGDGGAGVSATTTSDAAAVLDGVGAAAKPVVPVPVPVPVMAPAALTRVRVPAPAEEVTGATCVTVVTALVELTDDAIWVVEQPADDDPPESMLGLRDGFRDALALSAVADGGGCAASCVRIAPRLLPLPVLPTGPLFPASRFFAASTPAFATRWLCSCSSANRSRVPERASLADVDEDDSPARRARGAASAVRKSGVRMPAQAIDLFFLLRCAAAADSLAIGVLAGAAWGSGGGGGGGGGGGAAEASSLVEDARAWPFGAVGDGESAFSRQRRVGGGPCWFSCSG